MLGGGYIDIHYFFKCVNFSLKRAVWENNGNMEVGSSCSNIGER